MISAQTPSAFVARKTASHFSGSCLRQWDPAMGIKSCGAVSTVALALGLFFAPPVSIAIDTIIDTVASLALPTAGNPTARNLGFTSPAMGQPSGLTSAQSDALNAYNDSLKNFESILRQRRAPINTKREFANLPIQALYLARNNM